MKDKKNMLLSIIAITTLLVLVVGATYAYFTAQTGAGAGTDVNVTTSTTDNLTFNTEGEITIEATQQNFGKDGANISDSAKASATLRANNATNSATNNYYVYLNITNNNFEYTTEAETAELILTITDPNGNEVTELEGYNYVTVDGVSGFDITTVRGVIVLAKNYEITTTDTTTQEWNITLTFANLDSDQEANAGKTFNGELIISKEINLSLADVCYDSRMLEDCIKIYESSAVYEQTGLLVHDGSLALSAQDNSIRYSGVNPNNFVCFYNSCDSSDLYRIIGVYGDDIKVIKHEPLIKQDLDYLGFSNYNDDSMEGILQWNNTSSNIWNTSTLYSDLQNNYGNIFGSTSEVEDIIIEYDWILSSLAEESLIDNTVSHIYNYELGDNSSANSMNAKYGLMYISEYAYATSLEYWSYINLDDDSLFNCRLKNWMHVGVDEWTMTSVLADNTSVFSLYERGIIVSNPATVFFKIRPTFYLDGGSVEYKSGTGTALDPIKISW